MLCGNLNEKEILKEGYKFKYSWSIALKRKGRNIVKQLSSNKH